MNTNLLKEAIADADAIKKLAIENAKASLNEAFDSKIKSMLAARLEEEVDDLDLEEKYEEAEDESQDEAKKGHDEKAEEADEEDESKDEAKKGHEEEESEEDEADEAFDIDAILAEMEKDGEEESQDEAKDAEEETKEMQDKDDEENGGEEAEEKEAETEEEPVDEEIDIEALLNELKDEEDEDDEAYHGDDKSMDEEKEEDDEAYHAKDKMDEMEISGVDLTALATGIGVPAAILTAMFNAMKGKSAEEKKEILQKVTDSIKRGKGIETESEELQEIKRQAAELTEKVNETNLINAKLLYLNKILRKYNLSEQQKLKVINAFDKANTTSEAKIVHESLDQAFSVKNDNTKTNLKESLGFASSAAGTSTKRIIKEDVIANADAQVSRWQKLAGIIK